MFGIFGMNGALAEKLRGLSRVYLDTNVLIYYLQDEPPYGPMVRPVFEMIACRTTAPETRAASAATTCRRRCLRPRADMRDLIA